MTAAFLTGVAMPVVIACSAVLGFAANEWSHGGMAEALGIGHRHVLDWDASHCTTHDDPTHGRAHEAHMHGDTSHPHAGCPGGPTMHGERVHHAGGAPP